LKAFQTPRSDVWKPTATAFGKYIDYPEENQARIIGARVPIAA
jgi:hypothetical protein